MTKAKKYSREDLRAAVAEARKLRNPIGDGGPLVNDNQVLLIELCWSAEMLIKPGINIEHDCVSEIYSSLLSDLTTGVLQAYTHDAEAIVNASIWPSASASVDPHDMSFFHPVLHSWDWDGPEGTTPIVRLEDAVAWLSQVNSKIKVSAKPTPRPKTIEETAKAWLDYVAEFQYPKKPNREERRKKVRQMSLHEDRLQLLQSILSPPYWRADGRLPASPRSDDDLKPGRISDYVAAHRKAMSKAGSS